MSAFYVFKITVMLINDAHISAVSPVVVLFVCLFCYSWFVVLGNRRGTFKLCTVSVDFTLNTLNCDRGAVWL